MVGIKGRGQFLCVFLPTRIPDNTVINLQKGRKTFSRKIPASYKYCKIVKIAMYLFKHARIFRVFRKKARKIKVEYLRYINFPFLEIKTLQMFNVWRCCGVFWNIFLKLSGKHLWCSPNISKIFNRPPENRFNDRQYTTHTEHLSEALRQFMCLYFLYQDGFFTISGNPQNFWLHRTALLGILLMKCFWVFSWAPQINKKNPENFLILKSITKHNKIVLY